MKTRYFKTLYSNIATGKYIDNAEGQNILECAEVHIGKWRYYNANSGSAGLPSGEIWGFGEQLAVMSEIWIVIFISGSTGKIYHTVYLNKAWGDWYDH